ncbi:MAG: hypothetical protein COV44_00515 [Deltaproteobacteria bacterium CG11_big_fil_rev_8_21_14_0_20_45_16]|nr:MAG: hypothetical protein COV44_00515 [Deltaproteobacteria bacterium CG11_big_fil_rev_8_21_14_0_20_45_16]
MGFFETIIIFALVAEAPTKPAAKPEESAEAAAPIGGETMESAPMIDPFAYTYNPFGKRDPFESYIQSAGGNDAPVSPNPLLNFDLSKFRLTGVVWGMANPRAIVLDGNGKGHIITQGTRIGRNRGKVMRILKDQVVVAEEFRDPLGKLIVSEYSMSLNTEEKQK